MQYVTSVRNWLDSMAKFSSLSGAYKKRKANDIKEIPHSFTFARRDCHPVTLAMFSDFSNPHKVESISPIGIMVFSIFQPRHA